MTLNEPDSSVGRSRCRSHTAVAGGEGFRRRVQPPTTLVERPSDSLVPGTDGLLIDHEPIICSTAKNRDELPSSHQISLCWIDSLSRSGFCGNGPTRANTEVRGGRLDRPGRIGPVHGVKQSRPPCARGGAFDPLRPSAVQLFCAAKSLLDHLVGTQKNRLRHRKTERLGGLEVYDHLIFCRQLNG
jgi:hypothetical protein